MNLQAALGLRPCEMIAFVGAGGKTTAAWRLLRLLVMSGERAVFTTTTHIFEPKKAALLLDPKPEPADIARSLLVGSPALILAAKRGERGDPQQAAASPYDAHPVKLVGIDPDLLTELSRRLPQVTWLVEADGARGRELKAPAEHEPVIPPNATRVTIVAGLEALGQPLDERVIHRPEIAARILRVPVGTALTHDMLAHLVDHPFGGLKGIPAHATTIALLTQRGLAPHPHADAIAERILAGKRVHRVVLADLRAAEPVLKVWK